jgi:hypothetical protein
MRKYILYLVLGISGLAFSASPPYHIKDSAIQGNFEDIYNKVDALNRSTNTAPISDSAPRTNVTPQHAGQMIYNSTDDQICYATGTVKSSWSYQNKTTACSH